jgi:hypothetical protein
MDRARRFLDIVTYRKCRIFSLLNLQNGDNIDNTRDG